MQSRDTKQTSLEQVGAGKLNFRITGAIQPRCSDELPIPFFATYAHLQLGSSLVRRSLYMQWCVTVCQSQHSISDLTFVSFRFASRIQPVAGLSNHVLPAMLHMMMSALILSPIRDEMNIMNDHARKVCLPTIGDGTRYDCNEECGWVATARYDTHPIDGSWGRHRHCLGRTKVPIVSAGGFGARPSAFFSSRRCRLSAQ